MEDIKKRIRIVLVHPESSGNIGSVCRSMKTMGLEKLSIVDPVEYDTEKIGYMAVHAKEIFDNASFFPTLDKALENSVFSAGTTRRTGKRRKYRFFLPEEFCDHIAMIPAGEIAVVFGNEEHGLTDNELKRCSAAVNIPSSEEFPSLNLSHAVQIICYHIFRHTLEKQPVSHEPVTDIEINKLTSDITDNLENIGFFKITGKQDTNDFLKDIFSRATLDKKEAEKLKNIFQKIRGMKNK